MKGVFSQKENIVELKNVSCHSDVSKLKMHDSLIDSMRVE